MVETLAACARAGCSVRPTLFVCFRSFPCIAVRDILQSIVLGEGEKNILNKNMKIKIKLLGLCVANGGAR